MHKRAARTHAHTHKSIYLQLPYRERVKLLAELLARFEAIEPAQQVSEQYSILCERCTRALEILDELPPDRKEENAKVQCSDNVEALFFALQCHISEHDISK